MSSRPQSVALFEIAYLLSMALGLVGTYLTRRETIAQAEAMPGYEGWGLWLLIWSVAFWTSVNVTLWYLTAQRRSNAGRWIIAGLAIANVYDFLTFFAMGQIGWHLGGALYAVPYAISLVALWFLFQPDSSRWFNDDPPVDPEVFR